MDKQERDKWERIQRGEKPDTELNSAWIPPKSENSLDVTNKERLEQYKNAYVNALKDMNNQFGTDVKLLGITNNGNGSFTISTSGLTEDMSIFKRNAETFNKFVNKQLQHKLDPQDPSNNQNALNQQNTTSNQNGSSTYKSPTPLQTTPKKPTDIS